MQFLISTGRVVKEWLRIVVTIGNLVKGIKILLISKMFSSATNTINNVSPTYSYKSVEQLSTNKEYTYPGPCKSARKYAQDVMSEWVKEWLNR